MVGQALTDLAIRKLIAGDGKRVEIWDAKLPGFGVRASAAGTKSFVLVYRFGGKARRMTLGRYPTLSLSDARQLASEALRSAKLGMDPEVDTSGGKNLHSFADAVDVFVEQHCRRHNRAITAKETERILRRRFVVHWGNRDIRQISRSYVLAVLDRIVAEGMSSSALRALAAIRKFFNWAIERSLVEQNPCTGIKPPAKATARERVLDKAELAAIYTAAGTTGYPFGRLVQLLILTGQRRSEVAGMRWSDVDLDEATWTIPAELTKSNRTHTLPLSSVALEVLRTVPRIDESLVFPSAGAEGRSFSGFSKSKKRLDRKAGVEGWTLHDLRRTAATELARLEVSPHVVERILNHTTGILGGVAGVYNRFSYQPEMRRALELWGEHVRELARRLESANSTPPSC